jgi:hypothetical protein
LFYNLFDTKMKTIFRKRNLYWVSVIVIGVFVGISLQFVYAWVGPPSGVTPPGGNVGAPVTTGNVAQTKAGALTVIGELKAPYLLDTDNASYYVDPTGWSVFNNTWSTGDTYAKILYDLDSSGRSSGYYLNSDGISTFNVVYDYGNIQAPIYYDINDTNYYVDPNNSSHLNSGYFSANGSTGAWLNQNTSYGSYGVWGGGSYFGLEGVETDTGIYGVVGHAGWSFYGNGPIHSDSYVAATYLSDANDSGYYVDPNGTSVVNYLYSGNRIDSPIFYDSNNNGYYMDMNNTSRINYAIFDNQYTYGWIQTASFRLYGGSPGQGKILVSNADGWAYWEDRCTAVSGCACN